MPDITAQAPDGSKHVFPDGTDPAIIDRTMKAYITGQAAQTMAPGSFQQRPGGPILNANTMATSGSKFEQENARPTATRALNEFTLGTTSALSGLPESQNPLTDALKSVVSPPRTPQEVLSNPILTGGVPAVRGAEQAWNILKQLISPSGTTSNPAAERAHALGTVAGTASQFVTGKEVGESQPVGVMQELMGEGASKGRVLDDLHSHAIETQKHIAGVAEKVHTDAQQAMARVSQTVDASKPEGAFDKGEVRDRVKAAMGDTLSDESQLPTSLKKITTPEKPTFAGFVNKNTQGLISRLRDGGLSDGEIGEALKQQGFRPEEVKAALSESAGTQPGRMSFEEVKQARSDLGRQKGRLQGPAQAAADLAYAELSKILREGARDAKVEPDWIDANARYKGYMDDFVRSPLSKTLDGENAHEIMDPLTGNSRAQVMKILGKYTPFGLDMERIGQEVKRSSIGDTVLKLSKPTKMDLLMAGFSPKALAIRQAGPRIFRNPKTISAVSGKGFDAETIAPSKVFPSKAAAMKASKEPPTMRAGAERRDLQTRAVNDAIMDQLYGELRKATTPEDRARVQRNINDLKEQQ